MHPKPSYRPDIDGLRALAVTLVVLYHYGVALIPGGFVGVDVFFVISGFLITNIIRDEIANDRFTISGFYARRVRRIVPALATVVAASLLAGYWVLTPGDYRSLGSQAATAMFGISNFFFLHNTGYFDQSAELLPLLHTWSLSVEEQFYLVWPLLLTGLYKLKITNGDRAVKTVLSIVIAASFAMAQWDVMNEAKTAFFHPHTRAWELALGAILTYAPRLNEKWGEIVGGLGLVFILASAATLQSTDPFPGLNALPACLGAALLIWPKAPGTLTARILSLEPFRQVGLASYSIYLWHWPILVFYRHYNLGEMPTITVICLLIVLSYLLGFISLKLIERPFRQATRQPLRTIATALLTSGAVAASGFSVASADGAPARLDPQFQAMGSREIMWTWPCTETVLPVLSKKACQFGSDWNHAPEKLFLWGDSHAIHFSPILNSVLTPRQSAVLYSGCPATMGGSYQSAAVTTRSYHQRCLTTRTDVVEYLKGDLSVGTVVLAGLWSARLMTSDGTTGLKPDMSRFYDALSETLNAIEAPGRKIVLIGNFARYDVDPIGCVFAKSSLLRAACSPDALTVTKQMYEAQSAELHAVFEKIAAERDDVSLVSPGEQMCRSGICQTEINGEFLYRDNSHIRRNLTPGTLRDIANVIGLAEALGGH
jgi:peptidoglycan/LPS O-acetylase OafA/YrhL